MSDAAIYALLVVSFAVLVTAHVTLVLGLARRARPRARAIVAFVIPPLAPWWGARLHMFVRTAAWCIGAAAYVFAWVVALGARS